MAYDRDLAERIRDLLAAEPDVAALDVTERAMFGGLAFLIRGHMAVAASGAGGLLARADPVRAQERVETTPAELMEMRGRPMRGWLRLDAVHLDSDDALGEWVREAVDFALTLPPKV